MRMFRTSAGLLPGVAAALCVPGLSAFADDLRATQVLVEGGVFLAHAETEAAFARLDAPKPDVNALLPKLTAYWEGGGASFGQTDSSKRIGSGGSTSQMRLGVERGFNGAIVGAMASAAFGGVGSGDLGSQVVGQHVDLYGRVDSGSFFTKLLFGGSMFDFSSIRRGPENGASKASAMSYGARAAAQFGANLTVRGVKVTPTVALATYANRLSGYDECGGATPFDFDSRSATAAIGSFRLNGSRSFRVGPTQSVELRGFLGTEDVLGYSATRAVAVDSSGLRQRLARESSPTGRGVVGGLGVGTTLAPGVSMTVDYDYGRRDSISTHSSRARLGVSF